jgi:hypothetical protein
MRVVHNVTLASARRLWQYAIEEAEKNPCNPQKVQWVGDIGIWKTYKRGGKSRQDLVQRTGDRLFVYYGVTEDGIHGPWRRLVEGEGGAELEEVPELHAQAEMPGEPAVGYQESPAVAAEPVERSLEEAPQPPLMGDQLAEPQIGESVVEEEMPVSESEPAFESEHGAVAMEAEGSQIESQVPFEFEMEPPTELPALDEETGKAVEAHAEETMPQVAQPAELPHDLVAREPAPLVPKSRAQAWREQLDKAMAEVRAAQKAAQARDEQPPTPKPEAPDEKQAVEEKTDSTDSTEPPHGNAANGD